MHSFLQATSAAIYLAIGMVSAIMAGKTLLSSRCLPFHEEALGKPWEGLEPRVQSVLLALMRVSGLGFLVVSLLLLALSLSTFWANGLYLTMVISVVSLLFCVGLFVINLQLMRKTGAATPWKGALCAAALLALGLGISVANQ